MRFELEKNSGAIYNICVMEVTALNEGLDMQIVFTAMKFQSTVNAARNLTLRKSPLRLGLF